MLYHNAIYTQRTGSMLALIRIFNLEILRSKKLAALLLFFCGHSCLVYAQDYQPNWVDFNGNVVSYKQSGVALPDAAEVTISFWLRHADQQSVDGKYLFYIEGTKGRVILVSVIEGSRLSVAMDSSSTGGPTIINATTNAGSLRAGVDQHIYINKTAGGNLTIWIDDEQKVTSALLPDAIGLSSANRVGIMGRGSPQYPATFAKGRISDFAMYDETVPRSQFRDVQGNAQQPPAGALIYFGGNQKAADWNAGLNQGSLGSFAMGSPLNGLPAVADYPYYKLNWVSFDGKSSLAMTNTQLVNTGGNLDSMTLACWFEIPAYSGSAEQLIKAESSTGQTVFAVSRIGPNQLYVHLGDPTGAALAELWSPIDPALNNSKHHLLVHFSRQPGGSVTSKLFIDGVSVASTVTADTNGAGVQASNISGIGVMGRFNHSQRMTGNIADLRVYDSIVPVEQLYLPKSVVANNDGRQAMPPPDGALIALGGSGMYSAHWVDTTNNNRGSWGPFNQAKDRITDGPNVDFGVVGIHDVSNILEGNTLFATVLSNPYATVNWSAEGVTFERMRIQPHEHFSVANNVDAHERLVAQKYDAQGYDLIPFMHYSGKPASDYYHPNMGSNFYGTYNFPITGVVDDAGEYPSLGFVVAWHWLNSNNKVFIRDVGGMTGVNNRLFNAFVVSSDTILLSNLDGGSLIPPGTSGTYTGGGKIYGVNLNSPWKSIHYPVEDFVPFSSPAAVSSWVANLQQLKFAPGAEETGGLKHHVLRHFSEDYLEYTTDYTTLQQLVSLAKQGNAWVALPHPFYDISEYRDIRPHAMSIHNGHYYFNTAARGYGLNINNNYHTNPFRNWEKMLRIDPAIRAIAENDRYGYQSFGPSGALKQGQTDALDSGKVEAFVQDKTSVAQGEAALHQGAFVAVVDLEDGVLYTDTPPVKNNYPQINNIAVDANGITITTVNYLTDTVTWHVGNTGPDGNQFAYAEIKNSSGNATVYTQAFVLDSNSVTSTGYSGGIYPAAIDVEPENEVNEIDPESSNLVQVAVFGGSQAAGDTLNFDATSINPYSVILGPGEVPNSAAPPQIIDTDGDSNLDMVLSFAPGQSGIVCDDTEVSLVGQTNNGIHFSGLDMITTVGCDTGCHP